MKDIEEQKNTLYRNLNALKRFDDIHESKRGTIEYLYTSIKRSVGKEKISLVQPGSFPKIQKNIHFLQEIGFSGEELNRYLIQSMEFKKSNYLGYRSQRNKEHIDRLKNEFSFSNDQIKIFLDQVSDFFYCPLEKYKKNLSLLYITWFSKTTITTIVAGFPYCLKYSIKKINNAIIKINEISSNAESLLTQYPHLFYLNADTDFFRRLVIWLNKWHKRYKHIIEKIQKRYSYKWIVQNYISQPISQEEYLDGLQTEEYKKYFLFNPEESKKWFDIYKIRMFAELLKYVTEWEQKCIMNVYERSQQGERLSKDDRLALQYLKEKIQKKDQKYCDDLLTLFTHIKIRPSHLMEEEDDLPF